MMQEAGAGGYDLLGMLLQDEPRTRRVYPPQVAPRSIVAAVGKEFFDKVGGNVPVPLPGPKKGYQSLFR